MARISGFTGGFLLLSVAMALYLVGPTNGVATNLDSINVDRYLANTALVEEHMRCLIYNGPCDAIANEIKRLFYTYRHTGISTTRCGVCTPEQEMKLGRIAMHWQQHYPTAWRELTNYIAQG